MGFPVKSRLKIITQWSVLLVFIALINFNCCLGQNLGGSLKLDAGYSIAQVKDTRHSSVFRTAKCWNYGLQYALQGERSTNTLGLKFSHTAVDWQKNFITTVSISEMRIFYEHLRTLKNKNWQLGAYLDHGAFSTHRYAGTGPWPGFKDNSGFSYVIWSALGLTGKYHKALGKNWNLNIAGALPLLAFTERPPYSFTFPEDGYDWEEDILLFQSAYFKRAQFQTLTQFAHLQFQTILQHRIGQRGSAIGINYQWNYLFATGEKPLFRFHHHVNLAYQFSFKKP